MKSDGISYFRHCRLANLLASKDDENFPSTLDDANLFWDEINYDPKALIGHFTFSYQREGDLSFRNTNGNQTVWTSSVDMPVRLNTQLGCVNFRTDDTLIGRYTYTYWVLDMYHFINFFIF